MTLELALVALGSYLYWRAATGAAAATGRRAPAHRLGAAVLVAGLATLALDVFSA